MTAMLHLTFVVCFFYLTCYAVLVVLLCSHAISGLLVEELACFGVYIG